MHNLNHLYYFYIVAQLGNVSAAARSLKTSQPSLSSQIKTLEFNLDKNLFIKKGKFLELTSEGVVMFEICSRMFEVYGELENYLSPPDIKNNEIRLGISRELSRPLMTNLVAAVLKKYKTEDRPKVLFETYSNEALIDNLKTKNLDFIITNIPVNGPQIKLIRNFQLPVVFAAEKSFIDHIKLKNYSSPEEILKKASQYLILPSGNSKLRQETNSFLLKTRIKYETTFESDILASVVQASIDGLGLCILPKAYIRKELQQKNLSVITPSSALWKHQLNIFALNISNKDSFTKNLIRELEIMLDSPK